MSPPAAIVIWTDGLCTDSRGFGGWAYVRVWAGEARGFAGGERQATTARMELTAVVRALADLAETPSGAPLRICSDSALVCEGVAQLEVWKAKGWITADGDPVAHRELGEQIAVATGGRAVEMVRTSGTPRPTDPAGFVTAWSDFARDKCKAAGAFTAAIPKPNLKKFPGLA